MDPQTALEIKRFIWLFLLPPNGLLLLAFVGVVLAGWSRRHYRFGAVTSLVSLLSFYLLMTPAVSQQIMAQVEYGVGDSLDEKAVKALLAGREPPQAIVVLAGGSLFDTRERPEAETPSGSSLSRLAYAARLARWTALPILTSGGRASGTPGAEATVMARAMLELFNLPVRWIEGDSLDTTGNAKSSVPILQAAGITRILLVTEAFHMRRARAEFEAAGLDVTPAPHGWLSQRGLALSSTWMPTPESVSRSVLAIHEIVGYGWYALRRFVARVSGSPA